MGASQPVVARWLLVLYRPDFDSLLRAARTLLGVPAQRTRACPEQNHALNEVAN